MTLTNNYLLFSHPQKNQEINLPNRKEMSPSLRRKFCGQIYKRLHNSPKPTTYHPVLPESFPKWRDRWLESKCHYELHSVIKANHGPDRESAQGRKAVSLKVIDVLELASTEIYYWLFSLFGIYVFHFQNVSSIISANTEIFISLGHWLSNIYQWYNQAKWQFTL